MQNWIISLYEDWELVELSPYFELTEIICFFLTFFQQLSLILTNVYPTRSYDARLLCIKGFVLLLFHLVPLYLCDKWDGSRIFLLILSRNTPGYINFVNELYWPPYFVLWKTYLWIFLEKLFVKQSVLFLFWGSGEKFTNDLIYLVVSMMQSFWHFET